jgi:hypothetical protein
MRALHPIGLTRACAGKQSGPIGLIGWLHMAQISLWDAIDIDWLTGLLPGPDSTYAKRLASLHAT